MQEVLLAELRRHQPGVQRAGRRDRAGAGALHGAHRPGRPARPALRRDPAAAGRRGAQLGRPDGRRACSPSGRRRQRGRARGHVRRRPPSRASATRPRSRRRTRRTSTPRRAWPTCARCSRCRPRATWHCRSTCRRTPSRGSGGSSCTWPASGSRCRWCCRCCSGWASRSWTSGPTRCSRDDGTQCWIYDFGLRIDPADAGPAPRPTWTALRVRFQDAFQATWSGDAEVDGFNALVLHAGLGLAAGGGAARLREVPAPGRHARTARTTSRTRYSRTRQVATALVKLFEARFDPALARTNREAASRSADRRDRRADRRGHQPGRGPHPAQPARPGQRDAADELLRARRRREPASRTWRQAGPAPGARPAGAAAAVRDLRVLAAVRGRAPAVRAGRARWPALVGPAGGLPHRGARPGQGAGGEERGDRAGRREGRVRVKRPPAADR